MTVDRFINKLKSEGKSDLTLRQYRSSLARLQSWLNLDPTTGGKGGSPSLENATQLDISNFKKWTSKNLKPNTVKQTLSHVKSYYNYLVDLGEIPDNPATHVEAPREVKLAPKWLTQQEQNHLIRIVRKNGNLQELTLITVLLHTGLRVEELVNLRLSDVELSERKGKVKVLGKWNRYREIPLNKDVRQILEKYLSDRKSDSEYLFPSQRSEQMTTRAVQHIFSKFRQLTGIDHLSAHALRHTFGHELVSKKIALDVVARLMGHMKNDGTPNIQMTLVYTQPGEDDLRRAVEELSWL